MKKLTMLATMLALALMIAAPASAQTLVVDDDETSVAGVITVADDDFGAGFPFEDDDDIDFGGGLPFDDDDDFGDDDDDDAGMGDGDDDDDGMDDDDDGDDD